VITPGARGHPSSIGRTQRHGPIIIPAVSSKKEEKKEKKDEKRRKKRKEEKVLRPSSGSVVTVPKPKVNHAQGYRNSYTFVTM
jgi:Ca2+-dependent lipid-binding protein